MSECTGTIKGQALVFLPREYGLALSKSILREAYKVGGSSVINGKVFEAVRGGVKIFYPDGVIRFISNSWEGEMHV